MAKRNAKPGINKADGYVARVFCAEYDLNGMIQAYGIEFVHWLADEIAAGRVDCRQHVQRWCAHVALTKDMAFAAHKAEYNKLAHDASLLDNIMNDAA